MKRVKAVFGESPVINHGLAACLFIILFIFIEVVAHFIVFLKKSYSGVDVGSIADWVSAIATMLAFLAAGLAAFLTYEGNRESKRNNDSMIAMAREDAVRSVDASIAMIKQSRFSEFLSMAEKIIDRCNKYLDEGHNTNGRSNFDRLGDYVSYANSMRQLSRLCVRYIDIGADSIHNVCASFLSTNVLHEAHHASLLIDISKRANHEMSASKVGAEEKIRIISENAPIYNDLYRAACEFGDIGLPSYDIVKLKYRFDEAWSAFSLASRQNP